ncbi:MAG: lipoprotein [Proteobacteria bacterium]|nr:lipoprotein [Pseudomonadota bacterium]
MIRLQKLAITIFYLSLVSSCGQTGSLYLPESSNSKDADVAQSVDQDPQIEKNNGN